MLEKLIEAEARYEDIADQLTKSEVFSNQELMRKLLKEQKMLEPVINKFIVFTGITKFCNIYYIYILF